MKAAFGHPDVAIVLTCLSYYYAGLSRSQVFQCFQALLKLDDPRLVYNDWVSAGGDCVPDIVRSLSGVNMDDTKLVNDIITPTFSKNYVVVNFYLSQVVFPREAKEFPYRLGTSAWDLAESKACVTTGFSGTKDNRFLLPTSIEQGDREELRGTDALVLSYLLQPENQYLSCSRQLTGNEYLALITCQKMEIRVLLDVGAQMLDMKNEELARRWLDLAHDDVSAVVFFTDSDDLAVLTRDGSIEAFRSSPFHDQLDKCIVYLDDAHTRGTDLKLPKYTRALLTLGQKVTKDRLVQGTRLMSCTL